MAKKNKKFSSRTELTPEEMKAIGEIQLGPSRHEKFLNAHYKKLIVLLLAVMLLAAGAIIYVTYRMNQKAEASGLLIHALGGDSTGEQESVDSATLDRIIKEFPGIKTVETAQLLRGMKLVEGGEVQKGIDALQQLILVADEPFIRLRAQAFLANHYMHGGQDAKAVELWQAVSREGTSPYQALAFICLGDLAQKAGDEQGARAFYTQVEKDCPNSPLQKDAKMRLLILGVDAPAPETPQQPPINLPEGLPQPSQDNPLFPDTSNLLN